MIELACFGALLLLALAAWIDRPGALFEVATIGVAGAALWAAVASAGARRSIVALTGLAFIVCLTNTWPGRGWTLAIGHLPAGPDALLAPATILLVAAILIDRRSPPLGRAPATLRLAALLLVTATLISTLIAHRAAPAGAALLEILVPLAIGAVVIRRGPSVRESWLVLSGLLAGISVPAIVGIGAYVLELGFPRSAADLAAGKAELALPLLFQELTFGNVDHFSVLAVLLLPVAVVGTVRHAAPPVQRGIAAAAVALLIAVVLLVLSRLALVAVVAELIVLAIALGTRRARAPAVAVAAVAACLLLLFSSPSIRAVYTGTTAAPPPATVAPGQTTPPPPTPAPSAAQRSETFRAGAVRTGLHVFRQHAPFGVGTGRYPLYDPVHTAPHSLFVELLAENGVLGVGGLLAIAWYVCAGFLRLFRSRATGMGVFELDLACLLGAGAFLGTAVVGGSPLASGYTDVWPVALAILIGITARPRGEA